MTGNFNQGCDSFEITFHLWLSYEKMKEKSNTVTFCHDYRTVEEVYSTSNRMTIELSYSKKYLHPHRTVHIKLKFDSNKYEENPVHELVYVSENTGK